MKRLVIATVIACLAASMDAAPRSPDAWGEFQFLIGAWEGVGKGSPGSGKGTFAFEPALGGSVLIRRSHSEYPAAEGRPAAVHDDLMVVYRENGGTRAVYFDNENHVIHYSIAFSSPPRTITLTSDAAANAPRFRFVYRMIDADTVNGRFEIAPPGKPDAFVTYIEGDARRVNVKQIASVPRPR